MLSTPSRSLGVERGEVTLTEVDRHAHDSMAKRRHPPTPRPGNLRDEIIDYPGVPVDHRTVQERHGILKNVRVPIRPHFGVMGLAPSEADIVDSIPPNYVGGNIDDWRIGKGATMYYPVIY
jgi:acetamidase/formamidase